MVKTINDNYQVLCNAEITLEANPDDLSHTYIEALSNSSINRLSIGIQSFYKDDLKLMNRIHSALEARACLDRATQYFENISIDLIYGIPNSTIARWKENLEIALSYNIPHISSYALTVEPNTALAAFIKKGEIADVDDAKTKDQFHILVEVLEEGEFVHYELSNFGKEGFFSRNNSGYWQGKTYLGIGPSAHSFNGKQRSWNIRNNTKYIKAIATNEFPNEIETLTKNDRYNEYIMTGLRTIWGVSLKIVENDFGFNFKNYLLEHSKKYINEHLLYIDDDKLLVTKKGKFLSDGIASSLFKLNLK